MNPEAEFTPESQSAEHSRWMTRALQLADLAASQGEVPVGAVIVREGEILGEGYNQPIRADDPTAHAEIMAIRQASSRVNNYRLPGATLYVTIEPCTMCAGAMIHARIGTLVFGAREPRAGSIVSQSRLLEANHFNHKVLVVEGICAEQCGAVMQRFFQKQRTGR